MQKLGQRLSHIKINLLWPKIQNTFVFSVKSDISRVARQTVGASVGGLLFLFSHACVLGID